MSDHWNPWNIAEANPALRGTVTPGSQLLLPDGTPSAPALSFTDEPNMGFYRVAPGLFGIGVDGVAATWLSAATFLQATQPFLVGSSLAVFPTNTMVGIVNIASTDKGIAIKAHASQSANLQEWQNSSGSPLAAVDKDGKIHTGSVFWASGSGTPEGAVTAPIGSLYSRTDGGAGTSLYVKETGSGNTGWVGK